MEQEKLLKVSEDMKIFSIMNQLLENTFPEIIKKELEKITYKKKSYIVFIPEVAMVILGKNI